MTLQQDLQQDVCNLLSDEDWKHFGDDQALQNKLNRGHYQPIHLHLQTEYRLTEANAKTLALECLVYLSGQGSNEAIGGLFEAWGEKIAYFFYKRGIPKEATKELSADVFMCYRDKDKSTDATKAIKMLYGIARKLMLEWWRKNRSFEEHFKLSIRKSGDKPQIQVLIEQYDLQWNEFVVIRVSGTEVIWHALGFSTTGERKLITLTDQDLLENLERKDPNRSKIIDSIVVLFSGKDDTVTRSAQQFEDIDDVINGASEHEEEDTGDEIGVGSSLPTHKNPLNTVISEELIDKFNERLYRKFAELPDRFVWESLYQMHYRDELKNITIARILVGDQITDEEELERKLNVQQVIISQNLRQLRVMIIEILIELHPESNAEDFADLL